MSRHLFKVMAAAALAGIAGLAQGQLTVNQPKINNIESAGASTIVSLNVPPGLNVGGFVITGEDILVTLNVIDATGTVQAGPFTLATVGGTVPYTNASRNVRVDLSTVTFGTALTTASNVGLRFTASSATGTGIIAVRNTADETLDAICDKDITNPALQSIFLNAAGTSAFFVFSERLETISGAPPLVGDPGASGGNDNNQTVIAMIDGTDFQVNTSSTFTGAEVGPTGLSAATIVGASRNVISFTRNPAATTLNLGSFGRPAFNATPAPTHDIFDVVRNRATNAAAQVQTAAALAIGTVTWLQQIPTSGGADVAGALRVSFNNPLSATLGDVTFYNHLMVDRVSGTPGLEASLLNVTAIAADPANANAVLLTISRPGTEGVASDGLRAASNGDLSTGQYTLALNAAVGTPPQDLFGQNFAGTASPTAGDGIRPSLSFVAFGDVNGDGSQDAVFFVFDEPVGNLTSNTGFTVVRQGGVAVRPFQLILADGALPTGITTVANGTPAQNNLPGLVVSRTSIDQTNNGTLTTRETNNAIQVAYDTLNFNWDNDANTGPANDPNEAVPGTGDANVVQAQFLIATASIADASGNVFNNGGGGDIAQLAGTDRAAPRIKVVHFTPGDNEDGTQLFSEQDGTLGDALTNDRVTIFAGENFAGLSDSILEEFVRFGIGGSQSFPADPTGGGNSSFGGASANHVTLINSGGNVALVPGTNISVIAGSGINDPSGNGLLSSGVAATDRRAPYVALQVGVDGGGAFHGAFLTDTNADGFANTIRIKMTQPINAATVLANGTQFTTSLGTVTAAALDTTDPSVIVLTLTDGVVSMTNVINVTYKGASVSTQVASSSTGGTGVAVDPCDDTFTARSVPQPDAPTQAVAIMDIVGTALNGTTPLPPGTKVNAFIAAPTVRRLTLAHNNINFFIDADEDESSLEAFDNFLFGFEDFVYLIREASNNFQFLQNRKYTSELSDQGNGTSDSIREVVQLTINATNLTAITFTGRGETSTQTVTAGKAELCWDVLRSSAGDLDSLFRNGFSYGGTPIRSSAVITGDDGRFEIHVSAPISAFDGKSRLNSIGRPVILVVELPDGTRFGVSGVASSVNGGPLLFNAQNRVQQTVAPNAGTAQNATVFNINIANVGTQSIFTGWNLLPFARAGGFATTAAARPVLVDGVVAANVVTGTTLPFVGPLDQFVYWREGTIDGKWTFTEDNDFSSIIIDADCINKSLLPFTMTSFGVQVGSGITNIVGGYAVGVFNSNGTTYGVFQFGAALSGNTFFTAPAVFPSNTTTQGWGLFTSKAAFNPATAIRGTVNPKLDFLFLFRNNGPTAAARGLKTFEVSSLDLVAPTGTDNPNDTTKVDQGQAFFGHITP